MKKLISVILVLVFANVAQAFREPSSIYIKERAAARTDKATFGQWWVLDANPNEPWFTDGDGKDWALATEEFVSLAIGASFDLFLSDTASGVGSNFTMFQKETGEAESTEDSTALSTGVDQLAFAWLSEAGVPGTSTLREGIYDGHLHLNKGGIGQATTTIYWTLSYVDADGSSNETLIATSEATGGITASEIGYNIHAVVADEVPTGTTKRLLLQVYANVGTGAASTVTMTMEGDHDCHISFQLPSSVWQIQGDQLDNINAGQLVLDDDDGGAALKAQADDPCQCNSVDCYGLVSETNISTLTLPIGPSPGDFTVGATLTGDNLGETAVVVSKTSSTVYVIRDLSGGWAQTVVITDGTNSVDLDGQANYTLTTCDNFIPFQVRVPHSQSSGWAGIMYIDNVGKIFPGTGGVNGLEIGVNIQGYDDVLQQLTSLGYVETKDDFIVGNDAGDGFVYENGATARNSLGLGTGDTPTWAGATLTGPLTFDGAVQDYVFSGRTGTGFAAIEGQNSGDDFFFEIFSKDSDESDKTGIRIYGEGGMDGDPCQRSYAQLYYIGSSPFDFVLETIAVGPGASARDLQLKSAKNLIFDPTGEIDIRSNWNADGETCSDLGTVTTADINAGTVDATIGGTTPAAGTFTDIFVGGDPCFSIKVVGNDIVITDKSVSKTIQEMGSPTLIDPCDPCVPEGYNDLAGLGGNKALIKWIEIYTSSTDWTFTVMSDDDGDGSDAWERILVSNRSGNYRIYWDYPYTDEDSSSEFHYEFTDDSGSNPHKIRVLGFRLL